MRKEDGRKDSETWYSRPARRPRLGGGLRKAAPLYRRASLLGPQAALEAVLGMILAGLRGVFWAVLGGLGLSWDVLGGPGVVLANLGGSRGGLGRVLGDSWGGLGGPLAVLEASWRATWGRLGAFWALLQAS